MSKRVYISADYSEVDGDRNVVNELHRWSRDNRYSVDYKDTAQVVKGSVSNDPDCRPCDLKKEFNGQINSSSVVIFIIGDKTASRAAGSTCRRVSAGSYCLCTPYKQNANGTTYCNKYNTSGSWYDVNEINNYSYLEHEFRQAVKKRKSIVIVYNSLNKQSSWLPSYMRNYACYAQPFWTKNNWGERVGNYDFIKKALGYV